MLIFILSFFLSFFAGDNREQTHGIPYPDYVDQQFIAYNFDHDGYQHPFAGLDGQRQTLLDRKKIVFYCYFQLQKSKYSDTYLELLDRIEDIIDRFSTHPPDTSQKLLTWDEFKEEYKKLGVSKVSFIGYGSLSNAKDLLRTLPEEKKMVPIIGFGGKRIFKVESPTLSTRGLPPEGFDEEIAKLALEEKPGEEVFSLNHLFNGVIFELKEDEVDLLRTREPDYVLKRVPVIRVEAIYKNPIQVEYAYTLINNEPAKQVLKPHLNYLNLVINSYDDGNIEAQDTIRLFGETTFLADGKTNIEDWLEREVRDYYQDDLIVQPIVQKHFKVIESITKGD